MDGACRAFLGNLLQSHHPQSTDFLPKVYSKCTLFQSSPPIYELSFPFFFIDEITSRSIDQTVYIIFQYRWENVIFTRIGFFASICLPRIFFCSMYIMHFIKPISTNECLPQEQMGCWQKGRFTRSNFCFCLSHAILIFKCYPLECPCQGLYQAHIKFHMKLRYGRKYLQHTTQCNALAADRI